MQNGGPSELAQTLRRSHPRRSTAVVRIDQGEGFACTIGFARTWMNFQQSPEFSHGAPFVVQGTKIQVDDLLGCIAVQLRCDAREIAGGRTSGAPRAAGGGGLGWPRAPPPPPPPPRGGPRPGSRRALRERRCL